MDPWPSRGGCPAVGTLTVLCVQPGASPKVLAGAALLRLGFVSLWSGSCGHGEQEWGEGSRYLPSPESGPDCACVIPGMGI